MRLRFPALPSLLLLLSMTPAVAQTVEDVYPLEPRSGSTVSTKPTFKLGVKGTDCSKMKFRIVITKADSDDPVYTFDQSQKRNGWALMATDGDDEQPVVFFNRTTLANGEYRWRADAWNGVEWIEGRRTSTFRVDGIPPADVENLQMTVDRDASRVRLEWSPVTTDREGGPEQVARYKVYRYEKRSVFFVAKLYEIGATTDTRFEDEGKTAMKMPLLFYRVTAEDEVGNEPGNLLTDRPAAKAPPPKKPKPAPTAAPAAPKRRPEGAPEPPPKRPPAGTS